jgi:hypothetical protein
MTDNTDPQPQQRNSATHNTPDTEERRQRAAELFAALQERNKQPAEGTGDLQWLYEVRSNCYLPDFSDDVDNKAANDPESAG